MSNVPTTNINFIFIIIFGLILAVGAMNFYYSDFNLKDQAFLLLRAPKSLIIYLLLLTDLLHKKIICTINSVLFVSL